MATRAGQADTGILSRLVRVETILPTLATKSDLLSLRADFQLAHVELRAELKADHAELRTELKADHAELRAELKAAHAELRAELKADHAELSTELKADHAELRAAMKADGLLLRADMAGFESKLLRWMIGMGIAGLAMIFSFMNFQVSRIEAMLQRHALVMPSAATTSGVGNGVGGFPASPSP
ncbi:hypothetical protein CEY04_12945 [Achromobacter sp. HZ28]|nr:hypothetical protein CEY04_12945 [Achromobacter sp. HZ28]OWT77793.1 hypothetical protein CEY05_07440 [Achromobacter sp. HZ34]